MQRSRSCGVFVEVVRRPWRWLGALGVLAAGCYDGIPGHGDEGSNTGASTSGPALTTSDDAETTEATIDPDDGSAGVDASAEGSESSGAATDDTTTGEMPSDPLPSCPVTRTEIDPIYLNAQLTGFPACSGDPWGVDDLVPRYVDYAMIHEVLHVLGFAGGGAPHMSTTAHVYDGPGLEAERDVLFSPPADGGTYPGWGVYSPGGLVLDIHHDDYLDHGQANLPELGASPFLMANVDGMPVSACDEHSVASCTDALAGRSIPIAVPPPPPQ